MVDFLFCNFPDYVPILQHHQIKTLLHSVPYFLYNGYIPPRGFAPWPPECLCLWAFCCISMKNVIALIDGFNLYHALDASIENGRDINGQKKYHKLYAHYKWLDLEKLCQCFLTKDETLSTVYYFTALTTWSEEKTKRHRLYIRALESMGIQTIYGAFKEKEVFCTECKNIFLKREEKRTDVNIAIHLLGLAQSNTYDRVLLVTGDSDLIPAIEWVRKIYPDKRISVITPPGRRMTKHLRAVATDAAVIKEIHLKTSQLPKIVEIDDAQILSPY